MKFLLTILLTLLVAAGGFIFLVRPFSDPEETESTVTNYPITTDRTAETPEPVVDVTPEPTRPMNDSAVIENDVPFTSQAPAGNWTDPRQQDACEESSLLMAVLWARGESLTQDRALTDILALSHRSEELFGYYQDTNTADTAALLENFFGFTNYTLTADITTDDIETSLRQGGVVVVPADGQILDNPNFTDPGPAHHMLVVTGYDSTTDTFITNDPGTRNGENFRYTRENLDAALADYPTGNHAARTADTTSMITIFR